MALSVAYPLKIILLAVSKVAGCRLWVAAGYRNTTAALMDPTPSTWRPSSLKGYKRWMAKSIQMAVSKGPDNNEETPIYMYHGRVDVFLELFRRGGSSPQVEL